MNQPFLNVSQPLIPVIKSGARWRLPLFRSGLALMALDAALYVCALIRVQAVEPLDAKLRAAAWFFIIGSAVSLVALPLVLFGYGSKRIGLAAGCLLSLPFWYGLTLY
jgi:hypothetical protein